MTRQRSLSSTILNAAILSIVTLTVLTLATPAIAQNPVPAAYQNRVPDGIAPGGAGFNVSVNGAGFGMSTTTTTSRKPSRKATSPNNNSPLFLPAVAYASSGNSTLAMADVNGDGKLDVLVGDVSSVGIMLGNGDGTFQPAQCWGVDGSSVCGKFNSLVIYPTSIAVVDVNGDGKSDLVVAFQQSNTYTEPVGVMLGNGDGTFQPLQVYNSGGVYATSVAVADVNGDGKPDLVVANLCAANNECDNGASVSVLLGNGKGTFRAAQSFSSGGFFASSVAVADVNGDGNPDILVINGEGSTTNGNVGVLLGNGNGTFQPAVNYPTAATLATTVAGDMVVADVNGDGQLDLIVSSQCLDSSCVQGAISVLLGNGDGTFQAPQTYSSGGYGAGHLALGDVNGDGVLDVLVANDCAIGSGCHLGFQSSGDGLLGVLLGNGDGTFQTAQTYYSGGWGGLAVAVGDLTARGKLDAVVTDGCGQTCVGVVGVVGVLLSNNGKPATAATLVASADPVMLNQTVTYTATVVSQSGEPVTGTVSFQDAWTSVATVTLSAGQAAYSTSYSKAAVHPISAVYSGDANNAESSSNVVAESAAEGLTKTTTVLAASASTVAIGQPVTLSATVAWAYGTVPNGELITFYFDSAEIGTATTNGGVATITTSLVTPGSFFVKATYAGDSNFKTSLASLAEVVDKATSTTTLTSSRNPSSYEQSVTFTASVSPQFSGTPTGSVTFYSGTATLGTATLVNGVASYTTTKLAVGTASITAEYKGSGFFDTSTSSALSQVVNQTSTTTTLVSSANPSSYKQSVTFTATVAGRFGGTVTGSVVFTDGSTTLATVGLDGGAAKYTTTTLAAGTHSLTATYEGNSEFTGSASARLTQTVNQSITTTTLVSSLNPSSPKESVTFTASVTAQFGGGVSGSVTFRDGTTTLKTVNLSGGPAKYTTSTLASGTHNITATYNGSSDFITSISPVLTQTVN